MRIYVDKEDQKVEITEFAYKTDDMTGDVVVKFINSAYVHVLDSDNDIVAVKTKDIPKLIKALEMAYKEWGQE